MGPPDMLPRGANSHLVALRPSMATSSHQRNPPKPPMNWKDPNSPWARTVRRRRIVAAVPLALFAVMMFFVGPWNLAMGLQRAWPIADLTAFLADHWSALVASFAMIVMVMPVRATWTKHSRILRDVPRTSGRVCPDCGVIVKWPRANSFADGRGGDEGEDGESAPEASESGPRIAHCRACESRFDADLLPQWWEDWGGTVFGGPAPPLANLSDRSAAGTAPLDKSDPSSDSDPSDASRNRGRHDAATAPPGALAVDWSIRPRELIPASLQAGLSIVGFFFSALVVAVAAFVLGFGEFGIAVLRAMVAGSLGVYCLHLFRLALTWGGSREVRCANCDYQRPPLDEIPPRCPECGAAWREPGGTRRGRPVIRGTWLVLAIAAAVTLMSTASRSLMQVDGVTSGAIPTFLLLRSISIDPTSADQSLQAGPAIWGALATRDLDEDWIRRITEHLLNLRESNPSAPPDRGSGAWLEEMAFSGRLPDDLLDAFFRSELRVVLEGPETAILGRPEVWRVAIKPGPHARRGTFAGRAALVVRAMRVEFDGTSTVLHAPTRGAPTPTSLVEIDGPPGSQHAAQATAIAVRFDRRGNDPIGPATITATVELRVISDAENAAHDATLGADGSSSPLWSQTRALEKTLTLTEAVPPLPDAWDATPVDATPERSDDGRWETLRRLLDLPEVGSDEVSTDVVGP